MLLCWEPLADAVVIKIIHYNDVIIGAMVSRITNLTIVYSTVYSGADQRKHQSSALLAFMRGIHLRPVNSPHKWPLTRKMFPFDDVITNELINTMRGGGKMTSSLQRIFSNMITWIKSLIQHCFQQWLVTEQATNHYLNQWSPDYWRIYASLDLDDLIIPKHPCGFYINSTFRYSISYRLRWM